MYGWLLALLLLLGTFAADVVGPGDTAVGKPGPAKFDGGVFPPPAKVRALDGGVFPPPRDQN